MTERTPQNDPGAPAGGAPPAGDGTTPVAAVAAADFAQPVWECDMVMQGGITSGIVYPAAILRLAQRFRLKTIGGTSAGAIAAAVAAAAEFRRASDPSDPGAGYVLLKSSIMTWLGRGTNLQSLFIPVVALAPLFWMFLWLLGLGSAMRRFTVRGAINLVVSFAILLFALYGAVAALFGSPDWPLFEAARIVAIVVVAAFVLMAIAVALLLPRSNFGICTGGRRGTFPNLLHPKTEPLTFWLSAQIDAIANTGTNRPLTFGDLWLGRVAAAGEHPRKPADPVIELKMVTTSLTMGRPFTFPLDTEIFYFRPEDLRRLFPGYVVDWLEAHARAANPKDPNEVARHAYLQERGYLPLPLPGDVPIILGTRMSLSFPVLLSAVRLWAIDWTLPANKANPAQPQIEPVWFSDGGVSSNFPIALFDAPLPSRPTLGIMLDQFPPGVDPNVPANGVEIALDNKQNIGSVWTRFTDDGGFFGAIINAMQNWQDTMQSDAPGFRDRIAHVRLTATEGGLNLTMPPSVIATLQRRGELAGALLLDHFAVPPAPGIITTWHNHRRVRLRTTLDVAQRYAARFDRTWDAPGTPAGQPSYPEILAGMLSGPDGYPFTSPAQLAEAQRVAVQLHGVAGDVPPEDSVSTGAPRPVSDLHARPRF
jgi:predicted acylesterase/phospholipase RssA